MSQAAANLTSPQKDHVRGKLSLERAEADRRVIQIDRWHQGVSVAFCVPAAVFAGLIALTITAHPAIAPVVRPFLLALLKYLGL